MITAPEKRIVMSPNRTDLELELSNGKTINLNCNVKWAENSRWRLKKLSVWNHWSPPEYKNFSRHCIRNSYLSIVQLTLLSAGVNCLYYLPERFRISCWMQGNSVNKRSAKGRRPVSCKIFYWPSYVQRNNQNVSEEACALKPDPAAVRFPVTLRIHSGKDHYEIPVIVRRKEKADRFYDIMV